MRPFIERLSRQAMFFHERFWRLLARRYGYPNPESLGPILSMHPARVPTSVKVTKDQRRCTWPATA